MESIVQLHRIDPDGLVEIIKLIIKEELKQLSSLLKNNRDDKYLTRKQAADFLHISSTSLYNLDKSQKLPARRLNGKVLYLKSDLLNCTKL